MGKDLARRVVVMGDNLWLADTTSLRAGRVRGRIVSTPQKTERHGFKRGDTLEVEIDDDGRVLFASAGRVEMVEDDAST